MTPEEIQAIRKRVEQASEGPWESKFWDRVDHSGDCWIWTGTISDYGYGMFYIEGRRVRAHRVSYEMFVGPIPGGLVIDHLCRVRNCVNPGHLEPVTSGENVLRGMSPAALAARSKSCPEGHEYTLRGDGTRYCRACHGEQERRRRERGATRWDCPVCGRTVSNKTRHIKTHGGQ